MIMEVITMMNLKVLVVDDEALIRNGICKKIERLVPNTTIVGRAEDAIEAIEMVKEHHPNIVITDIRMPEIDGLQFINMAKAIYSDIKFVVLSGFQDFEYARRAMRLGVEDYLLKPIDNQQLKSIIENLQHKIEEEQLQINMISDLKSKVNANLAFIKNKYLTDLISTDSENDILQIIKNLELIGIKFNYIYYSVVTISISNLLDLYSSISSEDILQKKYEICDIAEETLSSVGTAIAFNNLKDENQIVVIVNHDNILNNNLIFNLPKLSSNIINSINKFLNLSVSIGIGESYDNINLVHASYLESYTSVMQRIVLGDKRVIHIADIPDSNRITYFLSDENKLLLISCMKEGSYKKSLEIIDNVFNQIKTKEISYLNIKVLYVDLILLFTKTVKEAGGTFEKIFPFDILSESFISKHSSLYSIHTWIQNCVKSICNYILDLKKSSGKKVIEEILGLIDNYYYTDLSLNDLAAKYYINLSYLSQLFKTETGENFIDYLTKVRIEKAKELLKSTELKTYKISELVGYSNSRYFSDVFQKNVGVTPTTFRLQA